MNTIKTCYVSANTITHEEWLDSEHCNCSKPVFKYHDVTNNVFVLRCKNGSGGGNGVGNLIDSFENIDINNNSKCKKIRCNLFEVYYGEEYSYPKQNNLSVRQIKKQTKKENNQNLKDRLDILFDYAKVNTINDRINLTIQEINYIVKFKLHRLVLGKFNINETLEGYRQRIMSRPIIDKSIKYSIKKKRNNENLSYFINELDSEYSNSEQESESIDSHSKETNSDHESESIGSEPESVADYEDYGYCSEPGDYSD